MRTWYSLKLSKQLCFLGLLNWRSCASEVFLAAVLSVEAFEKSRTSTEDTLMFAQALFERMKAGEAMLGKAEAS